MLGVKITILITVIAIIWFIVVRSYLENNPGITGRIYISQEHPWWLELCSWLIILSVIGIIYSTVYLLFVR